MSPHDSDAPALSALLAEAHWIRGLAGVLVRQADLADDAAQEVWLAALRKGPPRGGNLRAWLAQVTRNAVRRGSRSQGRRRLREDRAAEERASHEPGALDVVETFSTQHAVASAVLDLEEPYRETILLRYYQDLSLREIGQRMGVATTTVETRLRRAEAKLRTELDRAFGGDGRSWALALVPTLAQPTARWGSAALLLAPLLAGVLLASWFLLGPRPRGGAATPGPAPTLPAGQVTAVGSVAEAPSLRVPQPAPKAPTTAAPPPSVAPASLEVSVADAVGTPLAGTAILLVPERTIGSAEHPPARRAQGDGVAVFPQLSPGVYHVHTGVEAPRRLQLDPGDEARLSLRAAAGAALTVEVVDAQGQPVPDAEVWLAFGPLEPAVGSTQILSFLPGTTARAVDDQGRLSLASTGARWIGARAPGRLPSRALRLRPSGPDRPLELRIELEDLGGGLVGRVLGPDGEPRAGAAVFLDADGARWTKEDGSTGEHLAPLVLRHTDAGGNFRFEGVRPGDRRLFVRDPTFATWRGRAHVATGGRTALEVRLERGLRLFGRVTDADGEPLEGAVVWAADRRWGAQPDLRYATATATGPDGRYELEGLTPGVVWLTVDAGPGGRIEERVTARGRTELAWDVELEGQGQLVGRVVTTGDTGLAGCTVRATPASGAPAAETVTDHEGRFSLDGLSPEPYRVQVIEQGTYLTRLELEPDGEEARIEVSEEHRPTARVAFELVDEAGAPLPSAELFLLASNGHRRRLDLEPTRRGGWISQGVPSGERRLRIVTPGHADLVHRATLTARETLELGVLRPAAALVQEIVVTAPEGEGLAEVRIGVTDDSGSSVRGWRLAELAPGHAPIQVSLSPGSFVIQAWAQGLAPLRRTITVGPDLPHRHVLDLDPGSPHTLVFPEPKGGPSPTRLVLRVRSAGGETVLRYALHLGLDEAHGDLRGTFALLPGDYALEAETPEGLHASAAFTISEHPGAEPKLLRFPLAPRSAVNASTGSDS